MNDWDDTRFFLAVARAGSVTAAARALGVNHSTVSRRLNNVEQRYGVRLFEPLPSGYRLTQEAAEVYEIALEIEQLQQGFARKLQGLDGRLAGPVVVTMPHDIFEYFMVQHLPRFQAQYPKVVLQMHVAKGLKNLAAREADVAVRLTAAPPEYLVGRQICSLHYGLYANRPDVLAASATPIITWCGEDTLPEWAVGQLPQPYIALQVNDLLAMYKAVDAGLGVARMPVYMHNFYASSNVQRLLHLLPISDWGVWVLSHVDLRATLRVQLFKEFLVTTLQQHRHLFTDDLGSSK